LRHNFKSVAGYYGTVFHEIAHSTGHKKRLDRDLSGTFGSESYAKEELIAEITSAMILSSHGLTSEIENTAAYCQSWLKALKNDRNLILSASGKSEKAMAYIVGNGVPVVQE
jgi:antirestriction protein ArdC